jgi:hypothetical protein
VPPTTDPAIAIDTYVRQATVPHGNSLLAQSVFTTTDASGPTIKPVDTTPFTGAIPPLNSPSATPITSAAYLAPFLSEPLPQFLPPGLDAVATIKNPTLVLLEDIKGQAITNTVVIEISTTPVGGILNIPFLVPNANPSQLDATFWIETVVHPTQGEFVQLQYVQRVMLDFIGIHWPHVSVATLRKL